MIDLADPATYEHSCHAGPLCPVAAHDCPREAFLEDPITVAYGVGNEMVHLIACGPCDDFGECHESCAVIIYEECVACFVEAMDEASRGCGLDECDCPDFA